MKIVFLVEEPSMGEVLEVILPQILSCQTEFTVIPHQGYGDLRMSIPKKLNIWREDDVRFVIVHDQDNKDCVALKRELENLCRPYNRHVLIRIACHELEAWYFGDLKAVSKAYGKKLENLSSKSAYRVPDNIMAPKGRLKRLIPEHQQISGAKRIAPYMDIYSNTSKSFNVFVEGVRRLERDA